jgi:hypothetical protein
MDETKALSITGGCQCGAVRYIAHEPLHRTHYCHCRMCQRATGNLFAALAGVSKNRLEWTKGQPKFFASSTMAERGFCEHCGTPLTFAYHEAARIYVTIGSLDHPERAIPERHYGIESQLPWLHIHDDLPREATEDNEKLRTMMVFQSPDS